MMRLTETTASLDVLLPGRDSGLPQTRTSKSEDFYQACVQLILEEFSRLPRSTQVEVTAMHLQKQETLLRSETLHLLWRGPLTDELLRRQAPEALPVPEAVDVAVLLGLVDGQRSLFDVWIEHEAMKWVGLPSSSPPKDKLVTPPAAAPDEVIAFLRRCEQAGVIRIETRQVPTPKQNN
jgi:hypothetical protein